MKYHPKLVFPMLPSPDYAPEIVPISKKSQGGCPSKLPDQNIHYAFQLIGTGKALNAVQVTKTLSNIVNEPLSAQTVRNGMKKAGMKAVVKKKRPLLTKKHRQERLDFALITASILLGILSMRF